MAYSALCSSGFRRYIIALIIAQNLILWYYYVYIVQQKGPKGSEGGLRNRGSARDAQHDRDERTGIVGNVLSQ